MTSTIPAGVEVGKRQAGSANDLKVDPKDMRKTAKEDSYVSVLSSREGCSCQKQR